MADPSKIRQINGIKLLPMESNTIDVNSEEEDELVAQYISKSRIVYQPGTVKPQKNMKNIARNVRVNKARVQRMNS